MAHHPEEEKTSDVSTIIRSPQLLAILGLGVLLVFAGVYLALRTFPGMFKNGIPNPITGEAVAPKGDPNLGIDFSELNSLPEDFSGDASTILEREGPEMPEPISELGEASGFGLIYPVTESTDTPQPTLTWMLFAPGPFKITIKDKIGQVVASAQNIPRTIFVSPKLNPGATYTWEVTAANGERESAQFIVLTAEQTASWQRVRSKFSQSHLALGLVAEQLGMLTVAEREYQELARQFPKAEAPARLLENVQALRD
jgi:hypothetical protein